MKLTRTKHTELWEGSMLQQIEKHCGEVLPDEVERVIARKERCLDLTPKERRYLDALRADLEQYRVQIGTLLVNEAALARSRRAA